MVHLARNISIQGLWCQVRFRRQSKEDSLHLCLQEPAGVVCGR